MSGKKGMQDWEFAAAVVGILIIFGLLIVGPQIWGGP